MANPEQLVARLPKCELHIHVEGSLEPELMFALAQRNSIRLPYESADALRRAYRFSRLQDFLDIYYQSLSVLITEQDFFDLAWAYLQRAKADNVRHVEMFFDPQGHTARGVALSTVIDGLDHAIRKAREELGIGASLIMCFLRHLGELEAEAALDLALAHRSRIMGVGLDSTELGFPPTRFRRVFQRAREAGFHLFAHAGEEGPPEYVWEAIDVLGVDRIDHGNRAIEDPSLVSRLARDRKPLTVCPLSNLRLGVVKSLSEHPLRHMMEKDLLVTLNSDDPAYFGGYVNDNYRALQKALDLTPGDIISIARNSFVASMMSAREKELAIAEFDSVVAGLAS
jgi:adenosine deaminase